MDTTQSTVRYEECYDREQNIASFIHMIMIGGENILSVSAAAVVTAPNCRHFEGNEGSDNRKNCAEVMIAHRKNLSKNRQVMSDKSER